MAFYVWNWYQSASLQYFLPQIYRRHHKYIQLKENNVTTKCSIENFYAKHKICCCLFRWKLTSSYFNDKICTYLRLRKFLTCALRYNFRRNAIWACSYLISKQIVFQCTDKISFSILVTLSYRVIAIFSCYIVIHNIAGAKFKRLCLLVIDYDKMYLI